MRRPGHGFRAVFLSVSLLLCAAPIFADTIVLKNGRRIVALYAVEEGDKVRYETSAGQLTLPKSIVDHIERGGVIDVHGAGKEATQLAITPPAAAVTLPGDEIARGAVHDGSIDREFIAKLEEEARSGANGSGQRAAMAHHAAAQFELSRGDYEHALQEERTALTFAPEQATLLMNVAYLHLRRSEYKQALDELDRAKRVEPESPDVHKLAGWAYYGLNKIGEAVAEWKRALALRKDPEVQAALEKAQRDLQEEQNYGENESGHFTLRYSGAAQPALARDVLRVLEAHFRKIESELDYTPPDPIGVVLYTQNAFVDITRAPAWVGALNDGRIRVPVEGLSNVSPELSRVLKHELTHSFLTQRTHGRCPVWLNEGLAQWMEGQRSGENAATLVEIYDAKQFMSLGALEGSWMRLSGDSAAYAYAWSLANVEAVVQSDGMTDVTRILDRIARGGATEAAVREVLHGDYGDVMQSTARYLRKTYGR